MENGRSCDPIENAAGKDSALAGETEYQEAYTRFRQDNPAWKLPRLRPFLPEPSTAVARMLYTRMLFSCLVDADYSVSAGDEDPAYLLKSEQHFDPSQVLESLYAYQKSLCRASRADTALNDLRDKLFRQCGEMGDGPEGLYTLTAPTGTGKTLALLHFALRQCIAAKKQRIIIVLPYLSITEQNAAVYRKIYPGLLEDHSQSDLTDEERSFSARWSAPLIVTTSVRFFEALFASGPTDCRKLHHIANSVVVFDEAQSLPADVTRATLEAVGELCRRYHTTMVFSTATQPDYGALKGICWTPKEILPDHTWMYRALRRTKVEWRIRDNWKTPLEQIAGEMAERKSVCAIVNLRRHAGKLFGMLLERCSAEEVFCLTTNLCPADRRRIIHKINARLTAGLPCRVVATQCIEAGVDFDFDVLYRALGPLDAIVQAAGRCNRNGRLPEGRVIVFVPEEPGNLYPDLWYERAAQRVVSLDHRHPVDIHNPDHMREYYGLLFDGAKDKPELCDALEQQSYSQVEQAYRLIDDRGLRVIVPAEPDRGGMTYAAIRQQALSEGMTPGLMKAAASITVSIFQCRELEQYAEPVAFARRGRESGGLSGFYLLRPQYESLYTARTGLQLPAQASAPEGILV